MTCSRLQNNWHVRFYRKATSTYKFSELFEIPTNVEVFSFHLLGCSYHVFLKFFFIFNIFHSLKVITEFMLTLSMNLLDRDADNARRHDTSLRRSALTSHVRNLRRKMRRTKNWLNNTHTHRG